ncbi:hypothetical protein CC2G_003668 [Coprinopsis cinerea AmutBmut pab1-1]|nr:hypothetical protein CC2G_003668 [Coprinopsis cinerea AmutBmut pab1-1]
MFAQPLAQQLNPLPNPPPVDSSNPYLPTASAEFKLFVRNGKWTQPVAFGLWIVDCALDAHSLHFTPNPAITKVEVCTPVCRTER